MANLNPNSTTYFHSYEPNTNDVTMAMDYTTKGAPALRVLAASSNNANRYNTDAWGRPKSVIDHSLFSASWTFEVSPAIWEEWSYTEGSGWTPITGFTNASSTEHMLTVKSTTTQGGGCTIASKVHPKYQPNRGHLYSTAIMHPNVTDVGLSRFGLGSPIDGCFFEIEGNGTDWDIFAARRYNGAIETRVSVKEKLLANNPTFDPSKGHVYDIQFQWRGAGNFYFFVDLELVHTDEVLGNYTHLSMGDPALPAFFSSYCTQAGTERILQAGCVDITSEGGENYGRTSFGSVYTGDSLVTLGNNVDTATIALRVPRYITYNGNPNKINSRGAIMDKLITWTRDEGLTKVWLFRDVAATNLNGLTWLDNGGETTHLTGGTASALNTAFQLDKANGLVIVSEWSDLDVKNIITNESANSPFNLTPGDILVVTVKCLNANVKSAASLYFSEEI